MKLLSVFLLCFAFFQTEKIFAETLQLKELRKLFAENKLDKYIIEGQATIKFLAAEFKTVSNPAVLDGGFSAEYFDLDYEAHLRLNKIEPIPLAQLTQDVNNLLRLHRQYYSKLKGRVQIRNYFQTAFIGLLHTIESLRRIHVGVPTNSYEVLTNLILTQGRLITSSQKEYVTMIDFWWDFQWARFLQFPVDLIELGNQKLRGVWLNEKSDENKKAIEKFLAGYSMIGLRKATNPIVYRDITNQIMVRLAKNAYEIYTLRDDSQALVKARLFKYKYETRSGLTEDAERTKREIAKEGLKQRIKKIGTYSSSVGNSSFLMKAFRYVTDFIYSLYSLARYFIGFLLITFPFDAAFFLAGLIILSVEGRVLYQHEIWPKYEYTKQKSKLKNSLRWVFKKLNNFMARVANDLFFGFHTLYYYYTSDQVNRNIRIGSSLLIFGLGLFFSSARTTVESFVAQMSL